MDLGKLIVIVAVSCGLILDKVFAFLKGTNCDPVVAVELALRVLVAYFIVVVILVLAIGIIEADGYTRSRRRRVRWPRLHDGAGRNAVPGSGA